MKKILSFMAFAVAMITFTACGDDNDWYRPSSERLLDVTSADVTFSPNAQAGEIVINSTEELSATSNAEWCTVSVDNNVVNVNVTWNNDIEARNAMVTVTGGERSVQVPVHQNGLRLQFEADKVYSFQAKDNAPVVLLNESNCNFDVTVSEDWIHVGSTENVFEITVDENSEANYRKGRIDFAAGSFVKTVYIGQLGTEELLVEGVYTASWDEYDDSENLVKATAQNVQIVAKSATMYTIKNLLSIEGTSYDIELRRNANTGEYYITSGYSPGKYGTYTLRCLQNYKTAGATTYSTATTVSTLSANQYRMAFNWTADDQANLAFGYVPNSTTKNETPGFGVYMIASSSGASAANNKGCLQMFWNLRMIKN